MARALRAFRPRGDGGEKGEGGKAGEEDATHGTRGPWDGEPEARMEFSGAGVARGNLSSTLVPAPLKSPNARDAGPVPIWDRESSPQRLAAVSGEASRPSAIQPTASWLSRLTKV
ncbi:hypothetical protein GCM10008965_48430 [Methylorubrum aminovorans]|nr:hypothetical protein GCM10025880_48740 [Methylorubrum aminovorans]